MQSSLKLAILQIVAQIPANKVMYFGQIADLVSTTARIVGFVLTGLSEEEMQKLPWYRVIAKSGYISSLKLGAKGILQKELLIKENYEIENDKVKMDKHLWLFAGINRLEDKVETYEEFIQQLKR